MQQAVEFVKALYYKIFKKNKYIIDDTHCDPRECTVENPHEHIENNSREMFNPFDASTRTNKSPVRNSTYAQLDDLR